MSEQIVRAHTNLSNRAKHRDGVERKTVFRGVVDNPFRVQWPTVPLNVQNAIVACIVDLLTGVAEYSIAREQASRRKRRRGTASKDPVLSKKAKGPSDAATSLDTAMDMTPQNGATCEHSDSINTSAAIPPVLASLTAGVNQVTKRLENLASRSRSSVISGSERSDNDSSGYVGAPPSQRVLVVCRGDIDPPALVGHLPNLVAICNSSLSARTSSGHTWLVALPKGAEQTLADALGLRRASVMLIEDSAPRFSELARLLTDIPRPTAPWMESQPLVHSTATLVPTHIKQLRTTAPKDMKAAKERRARDRAVAKERRRARLAQLPKHLALTTG